MNILAVGDVVGKPGVQAIKDKLKNIKYENEIDLTIVNGENSADGMGITKSILETLYDAGADVVTMGNHTWGKKDIFSFIDEEKNLIRPANYPDSLPGYGTTIVKCKDKKVGIIDLIGRVNVGGTFDSPFEKADEEIEKLKKDGADIIIVEFHAEATAEKIALGYYLKEKANIVYGTHTHVQTADEKIYQTGMGYITDIGMTGPVNSIIGMEPSAALKRFLTQIPERYSCAQGEYMLNAVVFTIDEESRKVTKIKRISL